MQCLDPLPQAFPVGFTHDISLVDVTAICARDHLKDPAGGRQSALTWLPQHEWARIKWDSSDLALLDGDQYREARSIGVVDSRCQMVGQGIFRVQQRASRRHPLLSVLSRSGGGSSSSSATDPRDDPATWTALVARSILYRVRDDSAVRGGQSGTPLCVIDKTGPAAAQAADGGGGGGTSCNTPPPVVAKVAGFASFVQMSSDVQRYDTEGDKLYKRLLEGRVAFYGAFELPAELREGYRII